MSHEVRHATDSDIPSITRIYNDAVANTTAVFTERPSSLEERSKWMHSRLSQGYPVLVVEEDGDVIGFSSFGDFRDWPGYRYSVEHSVYVQANRQGRGYGSEMMTSLIRHAGKLSKHVMIAGIEAGNHRSVHFHSRIGFKSVGVLHGVGRKQGCWLDLLFMEFMLDGANASRPD